jgi:hypothetical protein
MPDGSYIEAHVELREVEEPGDRFTAGGLSPGFSVTGEVYDRHGTWSGAARKRNGREEDAGGCVHEEVLRAFPHLEPLVRVHLADPDGTPMHGEANGWYFYSGDARRAEERSQYGGNPDNLDDHERAQRALNIVGTHQLADELTREEFALVCAELARTVWPAQAAAARAVLESLEDGAGVVNER